MITTRRTFLGLAAAAVTIPIAGCAPGGSAPTAVVGPLRREHRPGSLPEATITTLDTWTDKASMQAQWVTAVNAAFTAKYPKLKVKRTSATFDDINKTLKLKLSDASTPDVVPANNGWQGIGTFAKAGLILNLDAYAKGVRLGQADPGDHRQAAPGQRRRQPDRHRLVLRGADRPGRLHHRLLQPGQAGEARRDGADDLRRVQADAWPRPSRPARCR